MLCSGEHDSASVPGALGTLFKTLCSLGLTQGSRAEAWSPPGGTGRDFQVGEC